MKTLDVVEVLGRARSASTLSEPGHVYQKVTDSLKVEFISAALISCEGNQTHAAIMLGVHRNSLMNMIKRFNLGHVGLTEQTARLRK
jgi:DNA-binding protein Fis